MIYVYNIIEELCKNRGISITKLCKDCAIPRSSLTDYKMGRIKSLSADTLCKIADYFGVTVSYVCGESDKVQSIDLLKAELFGNDVEVTDEMWQELKNYAEYIKVKYKK